MSRTAIRLALAVLLPTLAISCADDADNKQGPAEKVASTAHQGRITLRGDVVSATPSSFLLDYGSGRITIEVDDWDSFKEGQDLRAGDDVFVTGRLDRGLFEGGKVEAHSVYAVNRGVYYFAAAADEEDSAISTAILAPLGTTDVVGTVSTVEGREFTVGGEGGSLRVDTAQMPDNPMDQQGDVQIRPGDRVYAWGRLDIDPGEAGELMAKGVVALRPARSQDKPKGGGS